MVPAEGSFFIEKFPPRFGDIINILFTQEFILITFMRDINKNWNVLMDLHKIHKCHLLKNKNLFVAKIVHSIGNIGEILSSPFDNSIGNKQLER